MDGGWAVLYGHDDTFYERSGVLKYMSGAGDGRRGNRRELRRGKASRRILKALWTDSGEF